MEIILSTLVVVRACTRDGHHFRPTFPRARPRRHATKEDVEERTHARGARSFLIPKVVRYQTAPASHFCATLFKYCHKGLDGKEENGCWYQYQII
jgi:hypothetical protein